MDGVGGCLWRGDVLWVAAGDGAPRGDRVGRLGGCAGVSCAAADDG